MANITAFVIGVSGRQSQTGVWYSSVSVLDDQPDERLGFIGSDMRASEAFAPTVVSTFTSSGGVGWYALKTAAMQMGRDKVTIVTGMVKLKDQTPSPLDVKPAK